MTNSAVFAAYGWDPAMDDVELLGRLLALDMERARHAGGLTLAPVAAGVNAEG